MKRWFAHPLLTIGLLLAWCALQRSVSPGTIATGVVLGFGIARLWDPIAPPVPWPRRPRAMLTLAGRAALDIVASNLAVARLIVLGRSPAPGFVTIPLALENRAGLAILACIITATPGTVWVRHDSARRELTIHVLDLASEAAMIATIQRRYERPLREIFP
jgi:multicomponent K+:H+ antiporter subunit E